MRGGGGRWERQSGAAGAAEWGGKSGVVGRRERQGGAARAEEWTARVDWRAYQESETEGDVE